MGLILHLTPTTFYQSIPADQPYLPADYERDGFIHCTQGADRMLDVANTFYWNAPGDFVVLLIDENRVRSPVNYEPPAPIGEHSAHRIDSNSFPHIYGAINRDAIIGVVGVHRDAEGRFTHYDRSPETWEAHS